MLTTNGSVIGKGNVKENVEQMFKNGLNVLVIDTYMPERDTLRQKIKGSGLKNVSDFGETEETPWQYGKASKQSIILMDDIRLLIQKGDKHKRFHNHCRTIDIKACSKEGITIENNPIPLAKKCVNPFRELCVKHNGDIVICCNDYSKSITFGNATKTPLHFLWDCEKLNIVRSLLFRKQRNFIPCSVCNYFGGFRQGIGLFDPFEHASTKEVMDEFAKYSGVKLHSFKGGK